MSATTLEALNRMDADAYTEKLGGIYEHSPWVAARTAAGRPYAGIAELHAAMQMAVKVASRAEQLALIRAHPQLMGKLASPGELTESSRREQAAAGLDRCSPSQLAQLRDFNKAYQERHCFPFIVAVRGLSTDEVIAAMGARIVNNTEQEFQACLQQIGRIARLRLDELVSG